MTVLRSAAAAVALSLAAATAHAQTAPAQTAPAAPAAPTYIPESGMPGKDVVWVPTAATLVEKMLDMAGATKDDYVIDLGSGDGRTVIAAAKRGIKAHGIEYNPDLVALSKRNAEKEGVSKLATFEEGDIFVTKFNDATVLTLFLLPDLNVKLRPTILEMKPGTRVVSNTFPMGDWTPDETFESEVKNCTSFCRALKWIVPAKVEGKWKLADGGELALTQKYQMLTGTLSAGGKESPISNAKMNGTEITFTADGKRYTGKVDGSRIQGQVEGGGSFTATRG